MFNADIRQWINPDCLSPIMAHDIMHAAMTTPSLEDLRFAVSLSGACLSAFERGASPASPETAASMANFYAALSKLARQRIREMTE